MDENDVNNAIPEDDAIINISWANFRARATNQFQNALDELIALVLNFAVITILYLILFVLTSFLKIILAYSLSQYETAVRFFDLFHFGLAMLTILAAVIFTVVTLLRRARSMIRSTFPNGE